MLFCWFHCLLNEWYYSVSRYKGALKSITMNLDFTFWQWGKQNSYSKRLPITMLLKLNKTWFERYWWVHNKETLQDYKLNRNNYQLHPDDCSKWYMIQSVTKSCLTLCDPMDCSLQAPLSMGFPRQDYGRGLPCPPPGDLPKPGIEPSSPTLAGRFFTTSITWEAHRLTVFSQIKFNLIQQTFVNHKKIHLENRVTWEIVETKRQLLIPKDKR